MVAKCLMVQGTASSVGKSWLVAALCRLFARQGMRVAPFKAQNMSLNSHVTLEGHEIGRAQAMQAEACGIPASWAMNPVLLKPCGNQRSQIIVNGRVRTTLEARDYQDYRASLLPEVKQAFDILAAAHDLVIIEGAGSPAEINLRTHDIANMGVAELVDAPVILVGDIDRGGVFAALYGTVALLSETERQRIRGFIINKFRGDHSILEPGLRRIEQLLDRPVLGVIPYLDIRIDEEDSLSDMFTARLVVPEQTELDIVVIRFPRLANYTDFAVLDCFEDVRVRYVDNTGQLGNPDLLILPGSKNTLADLAFLRETGLADHILVEHQCGTPIVGICGGFQMLGERISDPLGVEGDMGQGTGLGLLPMITEFAEVKRTTRICVESIVDTGLLYGTSGMVVNGYEIHMGETRTVHNAFSARPFLRDREQAPSPQAPIGSLTNPEGTVLGTYVHGFFDNMHFTRVLLNNIRRAKWLGPLPPPPRSWKEQRELDYDRLADAVQANLDMRQVWTIMNSFS